jgi:hypothetical protein
MAATDSIAAQGGTTGRGASNLIASDRVTGTAVRRSNGDTVGTIERLMIEKTTGKVAYAVMSFGGVMGIGEDHHTLPWHVLTYNTDLDAYEVNLTDEQLRDAPARTARGTDPSYDRDWEEHVHQYFNRNAFADEAIPKATHEAKS